MGVRASETGVTLKFLKPDGSPNPTQPDVTGEFAFFFSKPRPEAPGNSDPIHGSQDWLTDLIVVDNPIKLTKITLTQTGIQLTSAASKQVVVHWDVGGQVGTQKGCFTISKGHLGASPPRLFAETVKLLDSTTVMDQHHPLWPEWSAASQQLLIQGASPAHAPSSKTPSPGTASSIKP